jgi:hypothetical protein
MRHDVLCAAAGLVLSIGTARGQCTPDWIPLPAHVAPSNWVSALHSWDPDGPGPRRSRLVIAGNFAWIGTRNAKQLAYWDGHEARQLGGGVTYTTFAAGQYRPSGALDSQLIVGGMFDNAGTVSSRSIAAWDGARWHSMAGLGHTSPGPTRPFVRSVVQFGDEFIAAGTINLVHGVPATGMAAWNGESWRVFENGRTADDLHVYNGELYAAGVYVEGAGVMRWNGTQWVALGTGYPDDCFALTTWRGMLICGGLDLFLTWGSISAWDGENWHQLGSGINGPVKALTTFDPDGEGPLPEYLIAGGGFSMAGGQPASGIAAWDGSNWHPLGSGVDATVEALAVFNNQLYLGGRFMTAGGVPQPRLARWGCPQPPPPPPCYANCDQSLTEPVLNVDDFTCFINSFATALALPAFNQVGDYANCDESTTAPALNVDDFMCFINRFAAGCP